MGLIILRSYSIEYTFLQFFNLLSYYPTQNPPFNLETTLPVTSQRCFARELQAMAQLWWLERKKLRSCISASSELVEPTQFVVGLQ